MSDKQKIVAKCRRVYEAIECVEKNGTNEKQNYDFVRAADVVRAVRKAFIAEKLYAEINMDFAGAGYTIARAREVNAPFAAVNVKCSIILHDEESGETITGSGLGSGADTGDKSVYKAQTGALKYALRNVALLPDESDPEADESVDEPSDNSHAGNRPALAEMPDFRDAQHPESRKNCDRPTQAPEIAYAATSHSSGASQSAPFTETTSAPPAEKSSTATGIASDAGNTVPTEEDLTAFRNKFKLLGDDLSTAGKLKASKGLPINRKLLVFLLKITGAADAKLITKAQWIDFFERADKVKQAENGWIKLAKLVNKTNGIEDKE